MLNKVKLTEAEMREFAEVFAYYEKSTGSGQSGSYVHHPAGLCCLAEHPLVYLQPSDYNHRCFHYGTFYRYS